MNAVEKLVDLLSAVCLLFLMPLLYYESVSGRLQASLAGVAGEQFLKQISVSGEITGAVLNQLEQELVRYGCDRYELVRLRNLYEPEEENGVQRKVYTAQKEVLCEQIAKTGKSRLQKGDSVWLTLYFDEIPTVYFVRVRTGEGQL